MLRVEGPSLSVRGTYRQKHKNLTLFSTQKEAKNRLCPKTCRHSPDIILQISHNIQKLFFPSQRFRNTIKTTHSAFEGGTAESNITTHLTLRAQADLTSVKRLFMLNSTSQRRCRQESYCCTKLALIPCNSVNSLLFFARKATSLA